MHCFFVSLYIQEKYFGKDEMYTLIFSVQYYKQRLCTTQIIHKCNVRCQQKSLCTLKKSVSVSNNGRSSHCLSISLSWILRRIHYFITKHGCGKFLFIFSNFKVKGLLKNQVIEPSYCLFAIFTISNFQLVTVPNQPRANLSQRYGLTFLRATSLDKFLDLNRFWKEEFGK